MSRIIGIWILLVLTSLSLSCAGGDNFPPIPPDPPTQEELADLLGEWQGLTESSTGLLDLLNLEFYEYSSYVKVTIYLNNTYIDDVFAEYDGDRVRFYSSDLLGDYGEFDGYINHENLVYSGTFYVQTGISTKTGTFELYKL
jgi:hypothetical protein